MRVNFKRKRVIFTRLSVEYFLFLFKSAMVLDFLKMIFFVNWYKVNTKMQYSSKCIFGVNPSVKKTVTDYINLSNLMTLFCWVNLHETGHNLNNVIPSVVYVQVIIYYTDKKNITSLFYNH
jgi:hypothetical protein